MEDLVNGLVVEIQQQRARYEFAIDPFFEKDMVKNVWFWLGLNAVLVDAVFVTKKLPACASNIDSCLSYTDCNNFFHL
jgi:hypothetical protein